jgi:hypothetical protein
MYARSAAESLVDAALAAASTGSTGDDVRDRR